MKIYEIEAEVAKIFAECEYQGGEITPEAEKRLDELQIEKERKMKNLCWVILDYARKQEMIETEMARLKELSTIATNAKEGAKKYLSLIVGEGNKLDLGTTKISWRKADTVRLDESLEISQLPEEFIRVKKEPDKTAIKEYLKGLPDRATDWARLETVQHIQIK